MSTNSKPNKKRVSYTTSGNTALVLRTCAADMTAYEGFRWPEAGPVEAPDWDPASVCGRGLQDGLVANTRYRLNDAGEFVAAQEKP